MARTITLEKTYSEMQALIAANELDTQTNYKITDRGDRGLIFRAATTNRLEFEGIRYMLCPTTYATIVDSYGNDWIGVWNITKNSVATEGQLTIWNGLVWIAGIILSGDSPDIENSGWTIIPKVSFNNHEYIEMIFGVSYDFENDWINKQWDTYNNKFGLLKQYNQVVLGDLINRIDWCDWNFNTSGYFMFNNSTELCYNNSNKGHIFGNSNKGYIFENSNNGDISNNSNSGSIHNNSSLLGMYCTIFMNTPETSHITGIWNTNVTDIIIDKTGTTTTSTTIV